MIMATLPTTNGEAPFDAPGAGKPCKTWFRIVGDLSKDTSPVIIAHGGPGAGYGYLTPLTDLTEKYGIPVIFYDQIGCGQSTHLPEKKGDAAFWGTDLFIAELDNLVDHLQLRTQGFSILGQSWGGMLAGVYGARRPAGLKSLILSSAPADVELAVKGEKALIDKLPEQVRKTIYECEEKGDYESPAYKEACTAFYKKHMCLLDPFPEELSSALANLEADPTVYSTM
jgi:proline-specific peptidase